MFRVILEVPFIRVLPREGGAKYEVEFDGVVTAPPLGPCIVGVVTECVHVHGDTAVVDKGGGVYRGRHHRHVREKLKRSVIEHDEQFIFKRFLSDASEVKFASIEETV